jgi:CBS domain-containing protein
MRASDLMTTDLVCIRPTQTIKEAADLMLEHRISALPVIDENGKLIGLLSEGDLIRRYELGTERRRSRFSRFFTDVVVLAEEFVRTHARQVGDLMTTDLTTATPDTSLADIADLMEERRIRRVPILDHGKLVGIIARRDLVRALVGDAPQLLAAGMADRMIHDAICADIRRQPWANLSDMGIRVTNGVVRFGGIVSTDAQHKALVLLAQNIPGVKAVEDEIAVMPPAASLAY